MSWRAHLGTRMPAQSQFLRRFGTRRAPMIIFDGRCEREFLDRPLPHIEPESQDPRTLDLFQRAPFGFWHYFPNKEELWKKHCGKHEKAT